MSAAELFAKPHEFSPEEEAQLDSLTGEEIERRALADPDAQPATPGMLRRAQENRQSRLRFEAMRDASLGARLKTAAPDLDLPVFELTDEHGRTILLKASGFRRVAQPQDTAARVLKLEAVVGEPFEQVGKEPSAARAPEKQTT